MPGSPQKLNLRALQKINRIVEQQNNVSVAKINVHFADIPLIFAFFLWNTRSFWHLWPFKKYSNETRKGKCIFRRTSRHATGDGEGRT